MKERKKPKSKKKAKTLGPLDFTISMAGDRVVVEGRNGGNIRARGSSKVSFDCGPDVPRFRITCTEFEFNEDGDGDDAWAFQDAKPPGWATSFSSKLRKPEKGASQLIFKYTIEADVRNSIAADPVIIIDK